MKCSDVHAFCDAEQRMKEVTLDASGAAATIAIGRARHTTRAGSYSDATITSETSEAGASVGSPGLIAIASLIQNLVSYESPLSPLACSYCNYDGAPRCSVRAGADIVRVPIFCILPPDRLPTLHQQPDCEGDGTG